MSAPKLSKAERALLERLELGLLNYEWMTDYEARVAADLIARGLARTVSSLAATDLGRAALRGDK